MKKSNLYGRTLVVLAFAGLAACASKPMNVVHINENADPAEEISFADHELMQVRNENGALLAPDATAKAEKYLAQAKDLQDRRASPKKIIHAVEESRSWATDALREARTTRPALTPALEARAFADTAQAPKVFPKLWKEADRDLQKVSKSIAKGGEAEPVSEIDRLAHRYAVLEADAVVDINLRKAEKNFVEAKKDGAEKFAPRTYRQAELQLTQSRKAIEGSPRNQMVIESSRQKAEEVAQRLYDVTREVRTHKGVATEESVLKEMQLRQAFSDEAQKREQELNQLKSQNASTEQSRLSAEQRAAALETTIAANAAALEMQRQKAQTLEQQKKLTDEQLRKAGAEAKASEIRQIFTRNEADVFTQGNEILIRLKALNFPSGQANLAPTQYPILRKLMDSIDFAEPTRVSIEGHTDSTGSIEANRALSQARADAVREYVLANAEMVPDDIESVGYGFERPLASNRTAEGRAANRRIDVVLYFENMNE